MTGLTVHGECGKSWKQRGNRTGHCSGCHHTFEGQSLFDAHRKGGACADPAVMVIAGEPLRFDPAYGDGAWSARNTFAEAMKEAQGTTGTGEGGEAAKPQNQNQSEEVAS